MRLAPDMTKEERKTEKVLKAKLKERRANGERNKFIRRGEIIKVPIDTDKKKHFNHQSPELKFKKKTMQHT